jgi:hypothetical protein
MIRRASRSCPWVPPRPSIAAAVALALCFATSAPGEEPPIERREELTESLANWLHALSMEIRRRDLGSMDPYFGATCTGNGVPVETGETVRVTDLVLRRPTAPQTAALAREDLLRAWGDYLASFGSIEDVRLKVTAAEMSESAAPSPEHTSVRAQAKLKFFFVARDSSGRRTWVRGKGALQASLEMARPFTGVSGAVDPWKATRLDITELDPWTADVEMFQEVSGPAGVAQVIPAWGTPGNTEFMAHGAALGDVDRDGSIDIFVTGPTRNFLYLSRGDGTYEDVAEAALVASTPPATAPLLFDADNDGDSDLFLAAIGPQMFFDNRLVPDGRLEFVERSDAFGVAVPAEGYSAVAGDVNGDGFTDVYVCSYNKYGVVLPDSWSDARNGTPNRLFLNRGGQGFEEAAARWGVDDSRWSYAAGFADLNRDGRLDLYVANDFGVNSYFENRGDRFVERAADVGLDDTGNGMGVSFGDYDNDGLLDVHVTNMSSTAGNRILQTLYGDAASAPDFAATLAKLASGNTVYRNRGDGTFEDVSKQIGPFGGGWAFGGGFADLDLDGWADLYTPAGFISGADLKDT